MSKSNQAYRYFAFISYSSKDKAIVGKLQKQLETYRLPVAVRNELEARHKVSFPKQLTPIFRDDTDLPVGVLGKSILRELEDAKFLIVVCTPNSAQAEWVNQEVENFILMGRYEQIILYIADGIPNSGDPATESFPPILRSTPEFLYDSKRSPEENADRQEKLRNLIAKHGGELKGLSIQAEGSYVARMKIIARMLDIKPDDLIQRDKARKTFWHYCQLALTVVFLGLCAILWNQYFRVHVTCYTDYVECWGVPKGLYPLSRAQIRQRGKCWQISTRAGRVVRLDHVNAAGKPIPAADSRFTRPMIAEYVYNKGTLSNVNTLDSLGNTLLIREYSGDQKQNVDFKIPAPNNIKIMAELSSLDSLPCSFANKQTPKGPISRLEFVRNKQGVVTKCRFQNGEGYKAYVTDSKGIAGFDYKLDDKGRVVKRTNLDKRGAPSPDCSGCLCCTFQYDSLGNLIHVQHFDAQGHAICNKKD